ncbi:MAG: phenylphosphate carboxylase subunit gamma [Bacillota bacterium]|nr:phenylphosphate carboxylase subunit gamma [Bacillota bacterium]
MIKYDVYVESLADLPEGKEVKLSVRDLTPGIHKYCYKHVMAMVSANQETYPEKLQVRFGRGQLHNQPYSVQVVKEVDIIPERWMKI